jgi:two-component system CheB/CheR fusion protein
MMCEALDGRLSDYDVRIYATDIDDDALAFARRGRYDDKAVTGVPPDLLPKYFTEGGQYTVNRNTRRLVIFGKHNVVSDPPISHVDLLMCRNVLIYMNNQLQAKVLAKFDYCLNRGGILALGKAESLIVPSKSLGIVSAPSSSIVQRG